MPALCRIGDPIDCGDTMAAGSGNVFADGMPVTRVGPDKTAGHCWAPTVIKSGSETVYVNDLPVAREGDKIEFHSCRIRGTRPHDGSVDVGAPSVYAG